jgi:hypothetical protein
LRVAVRQGHGVRVQRSGNGDLCSESQTALRERRRATSV